MHVNPWIALETRLQQSQLETATSDINTSKYANPSADVGRWSLVRYEALICTLIYAEMLIWFIYAETLKWCE